VVQFDEPFEKLLPPRTESVLPLVPLSQASLARTVVDIKVGEGVWVGLFEALEKPYPKLKRIRPGIDPWG
jgi:hypothetical protein